MIPWNELEKAAIEIKENAYAPYSKYKVGASVLSSSGNIYTGVNVENASYGATICAERSAIFAMVAKEGPNARIKALVVATPSEPPAQPCGLCLQVISEFASGDLPIISVSYESGSKLTHKLDDLLPNRFSQENLSLEDNT